MKSVYSQNKVFSLIQRMTNNLSLPMVLTYSQVPSGEKLQSSVLHADTTFQYEQLIFGAFD